MQKAAIVGVVTTSLALLACERARELVDCKRFNKALVNAQADSDGGDSSCEIPVAHHGIDPTSLRECIGQQHERRFARLQKVLQSDDCSDEQMDSIRQRQSGYLKALEKEAAEVHKESASKSWHSMYEAEAKSYAEFVDDCAIQGAGGSTW